MRQVAALTEPACTCRVQPSIARWTCWRSLSDKLGATPFRSEVFDDATGSVTGPKELPPEVCTASLLAPSP